MKIKYRGVTRTLACYKVTRCEVLEFGGTPHSALKSLGDKFRIGDMPQVGNSINFRILLTSLIRFRWGRWGYYSTYIKKTEAKVVLVWQDTNIEAHLLARHVQVPVAVVQNGMRGALAPPKGKSLPEEFSAKQLLLAGSTVDRYFVFGEQSETYLSRFVRTNFVESGSFRLNEYARRRVTNPSRSGSRGTSIGLIVSFPNRSDVPTGRIHGNHATFVSLNGRPISFNDFFSIDALVAQAIKEMTSRLGYSFQIIGKRSNRDGLEHEYFSLVPGCNAVRVIGHEKGSGYEVADRFTHLIAIDSTLGYEMLALHHKVGFISNRLRLLGLKSKELSFANPLDLPPDGQFWTSAITIDTVSDFLVRFLSLSDSAWEDIHGAITPRLMRLDPGNSRIRSYLSGVLGDSL